MSDEKPVEFVPTQRLRGYVDDPSTLSTYPDVLGDTLIMARELLWRREQKELHPLFALSHGSYPRQVRQEAWDAKLYATQHPQKLQEGCEHFQGRCKCDPPQHLRCDFIDDDFRRCVLGSDGHTEHKFREPAAG